MNRPATAHQSGPVIAAGRLTAGQRTDDRAERFEGRLTADLVVAQAAYRAFGWEHTDWVRTVLDYHGLDGRPATRLAELADRHRISIRTLTGRIHHLRTALAGITLHPRVVAEASRPSTRYEDHLGRVRIATSLHVPAPARERPAATARPGVNPSQLAAGRAAVRLLATIGPLDLDTMFAAICRCRRFRIRDPLSARDLVAALDSLGARRGDDLLWRAPPGTPVPARYLAIAQAAAGIDLSRQQMIDVMISAGYTQSSASGRMSSSHPLFERVDVDRYRIIGVPGSQSRSARQEATA